MDYRVNSEESPAGMTTLEIASVGQRLVAWLVDGVIGILIGAVGVVLALAIGDVTGGLIIFVLVIVYAVVYLWLVSTRGQSPGKMAIGIKIVRMDGGSLGVGGALTREIIGKLVSSLIFYLGYIWILFDGKRQGWHDKIAGTYVVKA